ncbi:hypothetical protein MY11210_004141 [Beauveria gryllotalpidicola]
MNGSVTALRIDAVDAFARTLYLRTKQVPSPTFDHAAVAVHQMHISLRHLRTEAANPKSLLNKPESSSCAVYAAELEPIVDHCEFALRQLETVLDRFDAAGNKDALNPRITSITAKIAQKEMDVAFFLDTVQQRPKRTPASPDHDMSAEMKREIDSLASKVFSRHTGVLPSHSDTLWHEFRLELERRGFSAEQLDIHKTSAKAYIQRLGSSWNRNCGAMPTYQSVAEFEANTAPQVLRTSQPPVVPPKVPILPPKDNTQSLRNEKPMLSIKTDRRHSADNPSATVLPPQYSFNAPAASMDNKKEGDDLSMALVSTKELLALDSLNQGMHSMTLHTEPHPQLGNSSSDPSRSPDSQTVAGSPRYQSSTPADTGSHAYPGINSSRPLRLAPDRYGRDISPDAEWTKVRRALISLEVLDRARVRYEARPEYVAILGRLSRHEIARFARQSAECRAARSALPPLPPRRADYEAQPRPGTKTYHSDDDVFFDSSDSTDYEDDGFHGKEDRNYPTIVSAPAKTNKTSPSTTVKPKPILKNKNKNRVHFDPEPHEVEHPSSAPSTYNNDRRRDYYHGEGSSSSRRYRDHHDRDYHDRPHRSHRDRRDKRKKSWGETLGAVGIGSAALLLGGVGGF